MSDSRVTDSWWLRELSMSSSNPSPLSGQTDEGIRYKVLRSPDTMREEGGPVILECEAPFGRRWNATSAGHMTGQAFGMKWGGKVLLLRVVGGTFNEVTRKLELICR